MTPLLPRLAFETLQHVVASWTDQPYVVIGASALLAHGVSLMRSTNDVDVVVAAQAESLLELRQRLSPSGWETQPREPHRFRHHRASLVLDVIPAARSPERIRLARGLEVDLRGCEIALRHKTDVTVATAGLDATLTVPVPPLPVIALLKMIALDDNPHLRAKDIDDIVRIARHLLPDDDLTRWEAPLSGIREHELQCLGALGQAMRLYALPDYARIPESVLSQRETRGRLELLFARRSRDLSDAFGDWDDPDIGAPGVDAEAITAAFLHGFHAD